MVSVTPRPRFGPGKGPLVHIVQEAGWTSEPVWTQGWEEKSFASAGDRTPVVQSVVRHYTAWAPHKLNSCALNIDISEDVLSLEESNKMESADTPLKRII
jgi:hypothetical protein